MSLPPDSLRLTEFGRIAARYGVVSFQTFDLNGTSDALEVIFQAGSSWPITKLGIRQGSLTGTSPTYRISLQGVTTSGIPDGTIKASTNAYANFTASGANDNTFQWYTLTSSYTPTKGEMLAIVVARFSGTINTSNYCSFTYEYSGGNVYHSAPFVITKDGATRTKQQNYPVFGVGGDSSDKVYGFPVQNVVSDDFFALNSTPDEHAIKFRLPPSLASSAVVAGIVWYGSMTDTTSYDYLMRLYSESGSLVSSISRKNLYHIATNASAYMVLFNDPWPRIYAGDWYRLSLAPQSNSLNIGITYVETASADDMHALSLGSDMHASYRTNEGAWTDVPTRRIFGHLLLADMAPAEAPRSRAVRLRR